MINAVIESVLCRAAVLCVAACVALAGCEEQKAGGDAKPAAKAAEPAKADDVYTVRGVVKSVPEAGKPGSQLMIHHEEIPGFIGFDGKAVGMKEMTMPFPVAAGTSLTGIAAGDDVEFVFEVFRAKKSYQLTKIAKLPAGTELKLKAPK